MIKYSRTSKNQVEASDIRKHKSCLRNQSIRKQESLISASDASRGNQATKTTCMVGRVFRNQMPKRKNSDSDSEDDSKKKKVIKKSATPKLKKSKTPDWTTEPHWSTEKPEGEYASKSIERWCLLAPYDTQIKEQHWKAYYSERSHLDAINTKSADESKPIVSEELGQDTFRILRAASANVAAVIYGSSLDEADRIRVARTLRGSLYFTSLWGNDEEGGGDNPRTVNVTSRLYSPFGLGTSIDLSYNFHWRHFRAGERFSDFVVRAKTIEESNTTDQTACSAITKDSRGRTKPAEGSVKVFDMNNSKIKGTTAANIQEFEQSLFGSEGWLSPLKVFHLLCAAGTVLHYKEENGGTVKKAGDKFKFFQGETDGKALKEQEGKLLLSLKADAAGEEEMCISKLELTLARQEWGTSKQGQKQ